MGWLPLKLGVDLTWGFSGSKKGHCDCAKPVPIKDERDYYTREEIDERLAAVLSMIEVAKDAALPREWEMQRR